MNSESKINLAAFFFILILISCSILTFWPGITGPFLLDDNANLSAIQKNGGIKDISSLATYIFNDIASSFGRPISYLSFTINSQSWPAEPYAFKYTNILLHALNSVIVFALCFTLFTKITHRQKQTALGTAFLAALCWAIHPIQVSTVLYVVQRMSELSALFIFAGVLTYIHGRTNISNNPGISYLWMSGSIAVFGTLAFLSKENGVLLPLLILIVEFTLLSNVRRPKYWNYWAIPFIALPLTIIAFYFGIIISNSSAKYILWDFTLYERLLTQTRVLIDYLYYLILPIQTPSLYHDDFSISKGLFQPYTTLLSLATVTALLWLAIRNRSKHAIASFAILWFFAAHLLESTAIPLDIYFEHRNYTALLGPALAFSYYASKLIQKKPSIFLPLTSIAVITLIALNFKHSTTWGDELQLINAWSKQHPKSLYSQTHYIDNLFLTNQNEAATQHLNNIIKNYPEHLGAQVFYTMVSCRNNTVTRDEFFSLVELSSRARIDASVLPSLNKLFEKIRDGYCKQISFQGLEKIVNTLLSNKSIAHNIKGEGYLYRLKSEINFHLRRFKPTSDALNKAFEISPSVDIAIRLAHLHSGIGDYNTATQHLKTATIIDKLRSPFTVSQQQQISQARIDIAMRKANQTQRQ